MRDFVVTEITFDDKQYLTAVLSEDQTITELQAMPAGDSSPVGEVVLAVVETVSKNTGGAFLMAGRHGRVFLPVRDFTKIRESTPILVQIIKEAAGRKVPVAAETIQLTGKYAVVSSVPGRIAFSRKLLKEQKELLKKWIPHEYGSAFHILIRTNAAYADKAGLLSELDALMDNMRRILKEAESSKTGRVLFRPEPFYLRMIRDLYEIPDRVFSDIPNIAEELAPFAASQGSSAPLCQNGALSLTELYHIGRELGRLANKTVFLKSGAYLVIEQTEAFVSIDVNTGKCSRGKKPEETYRRINVEAAAEIARQLRLRNLSGMILVDFISMKNEDHKDELIHLMMKHVRHDHVHTEVIDLTPLGIMEIVRQKTRKPLAEVLSVC